MTDSSIPAPELPGVMHSDSLVLYGVKRNFNEDYGALSVGPGIMHALHMHLHEFDDVKGRYIPLSRMQYSVALAYAYAYDGHCYRFDSLRTFVVRGPRDQAAVGCGFDAPPGLAPDKHLYRMWRIRASTELLELATNFGDAKSLILDANLPGKKSPTSYAINIAMGHRSGRLTRE